ncbi:MAG TPA: hypothetical protein VLG16_04935 [Candidatus Saccharimonadales bacterium]|nr:hypothetical protein [Candidatus Saccharimonadales bacterium]
MQRLCHFLKAHVRALVFFSVVGLVVWLPLLGSGFVLNVDLVFTPHVVLPSITSPSYIWWLALKALNLILPMFVIEKLVLFAITFLSGFGMYYWLQTVFDSVKVGFEPKQPAFYLAGLLYAVNPFCYSRFMAGQYLVLLGYALLPFFARSFFWACTMPRSRQAAYVAGVWLALIGVVSLHILGMALILAVVFMLATYTLTQRRFLLLLAVRVFGTFLVLSLIWIIPVLLGHSAAAATASSFGAGDVNAFTTAGHGVFGQLLTVLLMHGFWADSKNLYIAPQDIYSWWWLPCITVLIVSVAGLILGLRRNRVALHLTVLGCVAITLSAGWLTRPIMAILPWFGGYREPQKFTALLVFVYCFGFVIGTSWFMDRLKNASADTRTTLTILLAAISVLTAPLMPWAFHRQLHTSYYPGDWAKVNSYFAAQKEKSTVLFLPWHLYMPYSFTSHVIANPAPKFFTNAMIIASNDPEIGAATGYGQPAMQRQLNKAFKGGSLDNVREAIAQDKAQYIIVAKEYDFNKYASLLDAPQYKLVQNYKTIEVFKVKKE